VVHASADQQTTFTGSARTSTSPNGKTAESVVDRIWSHDDFLAAHLPEPEVLIDGCLVAGTAANWHGAAGVGKTWAALEAARSIAGGWPWLGKFETTQRRVLIVDQESHPAKLQERVAALNACRPLPRGAPFHLIVTSGLYVDDDLGDPLGGFARLRAYVEQVAPDLLILDSFTRAHRSEENSSGAMADVNLRFRLLMDEFGIAVALIDHANKMGMIGGAADPTTRLRGSTEKLAFVDAALFFERSRTNPELIGVTPVKSRWVEAPKPFAVELQRDGNGLRLTYVGTSSSEQASRPSEIVAAIVEIQKNHGADAATKEAIAAYLGVSASTVRRYLTILKDGDLLIERKTTGSGGRGRPENCYDVVRDGD
jgi:AAA domain